MTDQRSPPHPPSTIPRQQKFLGQPLPPTVQVRNCMIPSSIIVALRCARPSSGSSLMLFALYLLNKDASNVYGMPKEHCLATSLHVAVIRGVTCDLPSLFGIVDCPLLAHATVMMIVGRWMVGYRCKFGIGTTFTAIVLPPVPQSPPPLPPLLLSSPLLPPSLPLSLRSLQLSCCHHQVSGTARSPW
jgi:hypothetical protein